MSETILYKKDKKGKMRFWKIWQNGNYFEYEYGCLNGETIMGNEPVSYGLAGRTRQQQLELRIKSKINTKLDAGYCRTIEEAEKGVKKNLLGYLKPMLANNFDHTKEINLNGIHIQKKLDGHRCLITNDCGEIKAYSRNGKPIETIDYILENMDLPEGLTIDGELYAHGMPLQKISHMVRNIAKKDEIDKSKLRFVCYDIISNDFYNLRYAFLNKLNLGNYCDIIDSDLIFCDEINFNSLLSQMLSKVRMHGYEGLILRLDQIPYEIGSRSQGLLKVKKFFDTEFLVVDVIKSKDGFGILKLVTPDGNYFRATAPGTHLDKITVAKNKQDYIGKFVNIKFAGLSENKIPIQPVATMWRNVNDE